MWCDTATFPRFFIIDARCVFPIFIFFFHMSMITLYFALASSVIFFILQRLGYSPEASLRIVKRKMFGRVRNRSDISKSTRRMRW